MHIQTSENPVRSLVISLSRTQKHYYSTGNHARSHVMHAYKRNTGFVVSSSPCPRLETRVTVGKHAWSQKNICIQKEHGFVACFGIHVRSGWKYNKTARALGYDSVRLALGGVMI